MTFKIKTHQHLTYIAGGNTILSTWHYGEVSLEIRIFTRILLYKNDLSLSSNKTNQVS